MELDELRLDCARRQKKGLHFICSSVIIWLLITVILLTGLDIQQKNILTFCCAAVLFPLALLFSKILKIDFKGEGNPLTSLGIIFSVNQVLYILIAMWVMAAVPDKMLMVYAMIFGAHLMPFSWLYKSKIYMVMSILVPIACLLLGLFFPPNILAGFMVGAEAAFSLVLYLECKKI